MKELSGSDSGRGCRLPSALKRACSSLNHAHFRACGGPAAVFLAMLALILGVTAIRGVFIIDEVNYSYSVATLRRGGVTLPATHLLPPSLELFYFLPGAESGRPRPPVPVSAAPPLYALLAVPFAWMAGWNGLIWLNILSMAACAFMIFLYTKRFATHPAEAWIAMLTFTLASFTIEYAQGVWPHNLSAALCTGGFILASSGRNRTGHLSSGTCFAAAGLALGLAAGVRYPNVIIAAAVAAGVILLGPHRIRGAIFMAIGMAPPLLLSSMFNYCRYGAWNPVSKSGSYTSLAVISGLRGGDGHSVAMAGKALMSRVVDFSFHHPLPVGFLPAPASEAGGIFCMGVLKKAWLQSTPWVLIVLAGLVMTVLSRRAWRAGNGREREMMAIALVVGAVLALFAAAGPHRVDGLCFNQRYYFDLLPLCATVFAWLTASALLRFRRTSLAGLAIGAGVATVALGLPVTSLPRHLVLIKMPVILACFATLAWLPSCRQKHRLLLPLLAAACLGWAATVHFGDDMRGSRRLRRVQAERLREATGALPFAPSMVFAYWGYSVALGPLQLDRDMVIADPWIDNGETAPGLIEAALQQNRRVFIVANDFPDELYRRLVESRPVRWHHAGDLGIIEVMGGKAEP